MGVYGDVRCECGEGLTKVYAKNPDSRRKLAVFGEAMFCANDNSCLTSKEGDMMPGPLGANNECLDMTTDEFYPITSYNTQDDNSDLDIKETPNCSDFMVTCETEETRNYFFLFLFLLFANREMPMTTCKLIKILFHCSKYNCQFLCKMTNLHRKVSPHIRTRHFAFIAVFF